MDVAILLKMFVYKAKEGIIQKPRLETNAKVGFYDGH